MGFNQLTCFLIILYTYEVRSMIPRSCMEPFNHSDCGKPPKPVIAYYKPGSRCEIEIWRGCPTNNMFEDEFICSHYCIGRLFPAEPKEIDNEIAVESDCDDTLHNEECDKNEDIKVYTFDKDSKVCIKAAWKGCTSKNVFTNEDDCKERCQEEGWDKKVDNLAPKEADEINKIIDDVISPTEATTTTTTTTETNEATEANDEQDEARNDDDVTVPSASHEEVTKPEEEPNKASEEHEEATTEANQPLVLNDSVETATTAPETDDEGNVDETVTT